MTENERWRAAYLTGIESAAQNIGHYGEQLAGYVRNLASLPPFETQAEAEIDKAIQTLKDALVNAQASRAGLLRRRALLEAAE